MELVSGNDTEDADGYAKGSRTTQPEKYQSPHVLPEHIILPVLITGTMDAPSTHHWQLYVITAFC
eukprot:scaffold1999_cov36-Attheya_sp.AAC.4